jgi:GABA(A) receptor-associated protein
MYTFKQEHTFYDRLAESSRVLTKYPERRPIICEKLRNQHDLPDIDKKKYLVPIDLTLGQFMFVIKKRLKLKSEEAIFLFINNKIITSSSIIGYIYNHQKDIDGFLYIHYAKENVFG